MIRELTVVVLLLFMSSMSSAQEPFTDFYDFKEKFTSAAPGDRQGLIDQYITWQESRGFPAIINDTHAVFIYYTSNSVNSVSVAGDMNGWNPNLDPMTQLDPDFNFFYRERVFEEDARIDYKFVVGSNWILDPRNPNKVSGGFGPNSELAMPNFVQPVEIIEKPTTPKGTLQTISTAFDGPNPKIQIYLPTGYDSGKKYRSVYFADGSEYVTLGSATVILDNMIHSGEIEPVIAVFVDPWGDRANWYNCSRNDYVNFLDKLVEYIDTNYATNATADARAHVGTSLGGQVSAQVGVSRGNVFKTIGAHSPAWYDEDTTLGFIGCGIKEQMKNTFTDGSNGTSWWMTAGSYEQLIWDGVKEMEPYFDKHGVPNQVIYLHEGHSWGAWRHTLDDFFRFWFSNKIIPTMSSELITTSSELSDTMSPITSSGSTTNQKTTPSISTDAPLSLVPFVATLPLLEKIRREKRM